MARVLKDVNDWELLWEDISSADAQPLLIGKFSPYCSISRSAEAAFDSFVSSLDQEPAVRCCRVNVVACRPVSHRIADDTGVRHQSPQAILLAAGRRLVWNASHGGVSAASLAAALEHL
jgi:bacillithiol system protein YtxJ